MQKEFLREKKENEDSLIVKGGKGAQEQKREIAARVLPGTLLVLFYLFIYLFIILVFSFTFTLDSLAVFEKLFLLIGVDIEGHFICIVESKFPSSLLCYDCVLDLSDFLFI